MLINELNNFVSTHEIEEIEKFFLNLKKKNKSFFLIMIEKLKVIFINSEDILAINKISLIFKEFKVHSAVPLIISKLLLVSFEENGGTLIYSLTSLRKKGFQKELQNLWHKSISYEMEEMLIMNKIYPD